jgi:hypothetical protein
VSAETASLVHQVVLGIGILTWIAALVCHRRTFRPLDPMAPEILRGGELDIDADPATVRDRLVDALRGGGGHPGLFAIEEASDRYIGGEATVFTRGQRRGSLRFDVQLAAGVRGTRATWRVLGTSGIGGLEWASRLFVYGLSPLALAAAAYLVQTLVLPSDEPAVRGQAVQTLQVAHFLWPPFLFCGLRRRTLAVVTTMVTNILRNAAF